MTTAQTRKTAKEATAPTAVISDYLDTLSENHAKFAETMKEGRERARRISEELTAAFVAGQRDLLGLARQIAANPTDMAASSKAVMDAAAAAQERSLTLGKLVYSEQVEAGAEVRKFWETTLATPPSFSLPSFSMPNFNVPNFSLPGMNSWFAKA